MNRATDICAFCSKNKVEVRALVKSETSGVCLCGECIAIAHDMVKEFNSRRDSPVNLIYPYKIKELLDREIIGQESAKEVLSVATFMHILRVVSGHGTKSNVLLVGPTGSGKTRMMQVLADVLDLPLAITDATTLTEAGYVGDDVESILGRLIQISDFNLSRAQHGIVYIDEIDKLARTSENRSISRDVSGEGVQQALLKLIEGTTAMVPQKSSIKHPSQDMIQMETKDILFICGGAFEGLERIIKKRVTPTSIGIGSVNNPEQASSLHELDSHDLVKFGMIPEFVGRLPIRVSLNPLTTDELVRIITEPKSAIFNQYQILLSSVGVDLSITEEAKRRIAEIAIAQKAGARGIRSVMEKILTGRIYDSIRGEEKQSMTIDSELVNQVFKP